MAKYLSVGNVLKGDKGDYITLDNVKLKEFIKLLTDHGNKHLKGLTDQEIIDGQKAKEIPRLNIYQFEPNENAPDFIAFNQGMKKDFE